MNGGESPERPVEARLRRALAARARTVTVRDLRPADPPGPHRRRTPLRRTWPRPLRMRRLALPLAGLATVAAVAIGYTAVEPGGTPDHRLPAATPGPVSPRPSTRPSGAESPRPRPSSAPTKERRSVEPSAPTPGTAPEPDGSTRSRMPPRKPSARPTAEPSRSPSAPAVR